MKTQFGFKSAACALAMLPLGMAAQADVATLDGDWVSQACEVRPQQGPDGSVTEWWLTRKIEMRNGRIAAEFTTYAGPGCGFALQRLDFAGTVEEVGASAVVNGAIEANLTIDEYVRFTPLAQGFADFMNSAPSGSCGAAEWQVGQTQDVLEGGCALLGLNPNEPTIEYEVLALLGDQLFFGARPVDGSFITSPDKRPSALLVPLSRE